MKPEELAPLLDILNPDAVPGKVVLITRYGATKIDQFLPAHIHALKESKHWSSTVWCCDPMHGNTIVSEESGKKTRDFEQIVRVRIYVDVFNRQELTSCLRIHRENGSHLGGVHFELTGEPGITGKRHRLCV
jgi:3-deoxy-7-phosphoheptulonate synthase